MKYLAAGFSLFLLSVVPSIASALPCQGTLVFDFKDVSGQDYYEAKFGEVECLGGHQFDELRVYHPDNGFLLSGIHLYKAGVATGAYAGGSHSPGSGTADYNISTTSGPCGCEEYPVIHWFATDIDFGESDPIAVHYHAADGV